MQTANRAVLPQNDLQLPPVVVIAASADGIAATSTIIKDLPRDFPAALVVLQHRPPFRESMLTELYALRTRMAVMDALSGHRLRAGVVYLARPDRHLTFNRDGTFSYVDGTRIRHLMSSANPLFTSAAEVFGAKAIAVVLTGSGFDGTDGVQAIRASGGTVIAQDPMTSGYSSMPAAAIRTGSVDYVLPIEEVAPLLVRLTRKPSMTKSQPDIP